MGLRLIPRTIEAIQAAGRLAKFHAIEKPRMEREAQEREVRRGRDRQEAEEAARRRREEEVRHEEERAYARERGERQAIIEMTEEVRQKEYQHASRMLSVRERAEQIAQEGQARRKGEMEGMISAITAVADRFKRQS